MSHRVCLGADIDTGEIAEPGAEAAHNPNKAPAMPKPAEKLQKQSNVSLAEVPTESPPQPSLDTAYEAGATRTGSPDTHSSHNDTALVDSKALSPSGRSSAKDRVAENGALPPKAGGQADSGGPTKASGHSASHPDAMAREI